MPTGRGSQGATQRCFVARAHIAAELEPGSLIGRRHECAVDTGACAPAEKPPHPKRGGSVDRPPVQRALRRLPEGGQPIKVGHHSEAGHRRAIARADAAIRQSIDADEQARRARVRADIAATSNHTRYAAVTVANRIEKLRADRARVLQLLHGSRRTIPGGYVEVTATATGAYAERLERELTAADDQFSYWQEVRAQQITAGVATDHSKDTVNPGDPIK